MISDTRRSRQQGMTLPLVAVFIVVLFVAAALAIDLGIAYTARTSAQHAADAAALAGAWTFTNAGLPQPSTASSAAIQVAAQTKILGQSVAITASNVNVQLPDLATGVPAWVTVTVPRTGSNGVATFFARAICWNSINVTAKATAEAAVTGTSTACLKPLFIPNTLISNLGPTGNPCSSATRETLFDDSGSLTPYAVQMLSTSSRQLYTIRPTSPPSALVPSQYFSVDYGSGANTYRCTLSGCLNTCGVTNPQHYCGSTLTTETGNMVGPTISGIDGLIGTPPTYSWSGLGDYVDQNNDHYDIAPNVVVTPIWNNCTSPVSSGAQNLKVVGFAQLFIADVNGGGDVQAYLINASPCAVGSGSGSGSSGQASGPLGVPIRLIKTQ